VAENALTTSWLASKLGTQSGRIDAMRRAGELFGERRPGTQEYLYPAWQFDEHGRPRPFVERLVRTAREAGLDDDELAEVLNRRAGLIGGRRLVDLIRAGAEEHVLDVVEAAGSRARSVGGRTAGP
jgi:hypothetical protein